MVFASPQNSLVYIAVDPVAPDSNQSAFYRMGGAARPALETSPSISGDIPKNKKSDGTKPNYRCFSITGYNRMHVARSP
jgi:hypothetical protein